MISPLETPASFELLFDRVPVPMWVYDETSLAILAVNEAALKDLGYRREEMLELAVEQVATLEVREEEEVETDEEAAPLRARLLGKDGSVLEVSLQLTPLLFEGRPAVLTTVDDRVEARAAEARNAEQASLLDLASDAIMVCDLEGRINFWNQGAARLYGFAREEALEADMVELLRLDPMSLAMTEQGLREKGEWSGQLNQQRKDGNKLVVNSRWTMVKDPRGEPKSVLVINTDLTETKKLETQFLRAQRLESIGTLASGIAHDLNNILSPILMSVAVLRRSVKDAEGGKILGIIESSAERGAGIVKQVLTFARGVEGERVLLQPKHLISEMGKILAQTFPRNLDIRTHFAPDLWMVTGDATQLHQVLLNLCVNARDAMGPGGGGLTVTAENVSVDQHFARMNPGAQLGDYVVLKVNDTGEGMPPEIVDKIFDPFFTTKEVGKGTGLGLATVMGIVKSHHGFLTVQSEVGVGTTFRIFLPAADKGATQATGETAEEDLRGHGELILVVDDEPPLREALVQTLQDNGYRAYTAEDGSDALALYAQRKDEIKLVLTDLAMAQMDGLALVRALRRFGSEVKVVVSSGHCPPEQVILLESLGVKRFLDKPYTAQKLLRVLHETLKDAPVAKG